MSSDAPSELTPKEGGKAGTGGGGQRRSGRDVKVGALLTRCASYRAAKRVALAPDSATKMCA
jgi:hypothetical protein